MMCEIIFCQEGKISTSVLLTGFAGKQAHEVLLPPLVMPSWVSNVPNCKAFFLKKRKRAVCERECVHVGASLSHKGFTTHTLREKHGQELTHRPMHGPLGAGVSEFSVETQLNIWIFSQGMQRPLSRSSCTYVGSSFRVQIFFSLRC